ncbi:hypothetical protein JTB14_015359 [Gonioctena quinquepunctata]|nr:hypothetical protein JTB14_015359 [Gonioctena quinquepunctata]
MPQTTQAGQPVLNWNLFKSQVNNPKPYDGDNRRDLDCLVLELTRSRPHKGEDLISFGTRLQLIRSSVAQRISNDTNLQADEKVYQISHYDKFALSTFIAGCTGVLRNNLHLKKPTSSEDAMAYIDEYGNSEKMVSLMRITNQN